MNVEATHRLFLLGWEHRKHRWCYVAGPMRGRPGLNREAFDRATKTLRDYGWHVFNPAETDAEVKDAAEASPNPLSVYMQQDLVDVCKSNVVFVLDGWMGSEGAVLEVTTAAHLGIPVYAFSEIEKIDLEPGRLHYHYVLKEPVPVDSLLTDDDFAIIAEEAEPSDFSRRVLDYVKPNGEATTKKFDHEKGHLVDSSATVAAAQKKQTLTAKTNARLKAEDYRYLNSQGAIPPPKAEDLFYPMGPERLASVREFSSGATRNPDTNKPDLEGFISPLVVDRFGRYMHEHRLQADGTLRSSDNWQKGMPLEAYMKSMWRHFLHVWLLHRGFEARDYDTGEPVSLEDALCGLIFNVNGYLLESLQGVDKAEATG